jgi:hypothetical protein
MPTICITLEFGLGSGYSNSCANRPWDKNEPTQIRTPILVKREKYLDIKPPPLIYFNLILL